MREGHVEILIVDNDDRIVELVAWFLKKRGFGVRTAASFTQARERISEGRPDLMLSDVDLGQESALEELPRLDAEGGLPPTLVVSGYLDSDIEERLSALEPVLDTLAKPFDFAVLEQRVTACLQRAEELTREVPVGVIPAAAELQSPSGVNQPGAAQPGAAPMPGEGCVREDDEGWVEITPAPRPGQSQGVG